jgi:hypothetical protein
MLPDHQRRREIPGNARNTAVSAYKPPADVTQGDDLRTRGRLAPQLALARVVDRRITEGRRPLGKLETRPRECARAERAGTIRTRHADMTPGLGYRVAGQP